MELMQSSFRAMPCVRSGSDLGLGFGLGLGLGSGLWLVKGLPGLLETPLSLVEGVGSE